jgi:non-ribosomal peptide synthetase component F
MYGPTEAAVDVTSWPVDPADDRPPPIGRPIANVGVHVVDRWGRLAPVGVPGELWVTGAGLARGYVGRPELTAERFVADPFGTPGGRAYRTGDRGRWRPDGAIELLGRMDDQLKVRGFRVEPAEVEAALRSHPGVADAAAAGRDGRLLAWVVPAAGTAGPTQAELRAHLAARVPGFLVPDLVATVDRLPTTPSGKLDRSALPHPDRLAAAAAFAEPEPGTESVVAQAWRQLLGVERVGRDDDFFALGGHSLLAVKLVTRLAERLGVRVPVRVVFEAPTLAGLAAAVDLLAGAVAPGGGEDDGWDEMEL